MNGSYWDTSALIPCFAAEPQTQNARRWLHDAGQLPLFTSWITYFEFETVLKRKLNKKLISPGEYNAMSDQWSDFQRLLNFIPLDNRVARLGHNLQKIYALWTCDSIQLGSASLLRLEISELVFYCLDKKLTVVAGKEGFVIGS